MHIQTITSRDKDTEICVSCPNCGANDYFDPRPWHHCFGCARLRASGFILKCMGCGDESIPTGDTEWIKVCTMIECEFVADNENKEEWELDRYFNK